jgi:hypothetical protein
VAEGESVMDFVVECKGCGSRVIRRGVLDTQVRWGNDEGSLMGRIFSAPPNPESCEYCHDRDLAFEGWMKSWRELVHRDVSGAKPMPRLGEFVGE